MMEALQAEFGTAPEVFVYCFHSNYLTVFQSNSSSGISGASLDQKKLAAEAEERRKFEEDRFIRLVVIFDLSQFSSHFCFRLCLVRRRRR